MDDAVHLAVQRGVVLSPPSRIRRPDDFPRGRVTNEDFFFSPTFTLQWHITQACDLNCRHCYDRSDRQQVSLEQGLAVLDELYAFCRAHHVFGQVTFTGGNPLLHPHFDRFYAEAARRGFLTAVLGNPSPRRRVAALLAVQKPVFFQVSLEGLEAHNDAIRGRGHYQNTMQFLTVIGELGVHRVVMLTLTRDNMDQVIPLADRLKDRTDQFTFNRLSNVGRGADLDAVPPERYRSFLADYRKAAAGNPVMAFKDNLFNLLNYQEGRPLTGGCTGHGCGAAFNFVSLLSDGEVHACRKFPSPIGNIYRAGLKEIYRGPQAVRYRNGSRACASCDIRPVCGGCLAAVQSADGDAFNDLDPCCFR
jgi:selenobiotic family peptide radical SAM maturase